MLMIACALIFVGQWPRLVRQSHEGEAGITFETLFAGALMGWIFIAPLVFYALALMLFWVLRLIGQDVSPFEVRYAIFWGLLAATPLILLNGLTAGLIGEGPALTLTGVISLFALLIFWGAGLVEISRREVPA